MDSSLLRQIPKMDKLLLRPEIAELAETLPRELVRSAIQQELDALRQSILAGGALPEDAALTERLCQAVRSAGLYRLRRVINATGIVLHTNLGRAPLGSPLAAHVAQLAAGYSNLEYDLDAGQRGSRYALVEELLCRLTGVEAALVVNNNAAAVFLMLNTLAAGKPAAISRGELVEIGGSFRVPEIMSASGAQLMEIGTTNRTHLRDYAAALDNGAQVLLKVHRSNFRLEGFTAEASLSELKELAESRGVPLLYDLGAGFLLRPELLGLHTGAYVPELAALSDVLCFSGDKLLGSGQAGILLGRKPLIDAMKQNQLTRMLRVDKMTLAALEAVLRLYLSPAQAIRQIPVLSMLAADPESLRQRAESLCHWLRDCCPGFTFEVVPCMDEPGGGTLPGTVLNGWAAAVTAPFSADRLDELLRRCDPPVVGRIHQGRLLLSLRTILPEDEDALCSALTECGGRA